MKVHEIQLALYHQDFSKLCVPNIYLLTWESDFLSVTKAGFITEYEIKMSRADYREDFKKCLGWHRDPKLTKHDAYKGGIDTYENELWGKERSQEVRIPKHFYFVCPEGLLAEKDVPEHCGLIYAVKNNGRKWVYLRRIIKAPTLKNHTKINEKDIRQIGISLQCRFWNLFRKKVEADRTISTAAGNSS